MPSSSGKPGVVNAPHDPTRVDVRHLTKTFGTFRAVDDVSFSVCEGEIVGLVGPNGAGKTTIVHMLTGLISPSAGTFLFPARMTVRENLTVFARIYNIRNPSQKIDQLLDRFGMGKLQNRPIARLSSGEAARVGLCKAFLNDPELLLLDEPTVYLDPLIALEVREVLLDLQRSQGTSIIYTSHDMAEVQRICSRIMFLNHGRIIANGSPIEVTRRILAEHRDEPALEEVFIRIAREQKDAAP
jgi:ABC-2 type transport system ATP-binding protein